jgi:hypothetical protein
VRGPAVALLAAVATLAASSGIDGSSAAYTAATTNAGNTFTAASDWVAPGLTLTTPADGSFQRSTSVTLSGTAGNASGDSTTVTASVYAGTAATGTPVQTRNVTRAGTAWTTAITLAAGTYTAQATQADGSGNTAMSASRTFTIDTTAPRASSIAALNGGAVQGRLETGDAIDFVYDEAITPDSVLTGWSGAATAVTVRFHSATRDSFTVLTSTGAATVRLDGAPSTSAGGVLLGTGADYVTNQVSFTASMTRLADGRTFRVVLGTPDRPARVLAGPAVAGNMAWTPEAGPTDLAGNALTNVTAISETDGDRDF